MKYITARHPLRFLLICGAIYIVVFDSCVTFPFSLLDGIDGGGAEIDSLALSQRDIALNVGGVAQLRVIVSPADAAIGNLIWSSSPSNTISVVRTGMLSATVIGMSEGKATISVASLDGSHFDTCEVTVSEPMTEAEAISALPDERMNAAFWHNIDLESGASRILIEEIAVHLETVENRALVERIVRKSVQMANSLYGQHFAVGRLGYGSATEIRNDDLVLSIMFLLSEHETIMLQMNYSNDSDNEVYYPIFGLPDKHTTAFIADIMFYLWSSHNDFLIRDLQEPPLYVDELPTLALTSRIYDLPLSNLRPLALTVKPDGNLLVGFSFLALELDTAFRLQGQPGRTLYEEGIHDYASSVSITPAGTLFFKPAAGRDIYRLVEGAIRPPRISTGMDVTGPFSALPDGSVVLLDPLTKKSVKVSGRERREMNLATNPDSYATIIAAGPQGNMWLYDPLEIRVRIHTPQGEIVDTILPLMPRGGYYKSESGVGKAMGKTPISMAVYRDGRFLLYYSGGARDSELWCFERSGIPLWRLDSLPGPDGEGEPLPTIAEVAVDSERGLIYLADPGGGRLIKLIDASYDRDPDLTYEYLIYELNRDIHRDPDDRNARKRLAILYEEAEALEMAHEAWKRLLDIDPFNADAVERMNLLEANLLLAFARQLRDKALEQMDAVGLETARPSYAKAIQLYEYILSRNPQTKNAREEMETLKARFSATGNTRTNESAPLEITNLEVIDLFPSLMRQYGIDPVGHISVRNDSESTVEDLQASYYIKGFMDFPYTGGTISSLESGGTKNLELYAVLNQSVLSLQEDLPVQARIEVSYLHDGEIEKVTQTASLTLFRRTALKWDDSAKICAFITPHEETISRFAHRVGGKSRDEYRLPSKFLHAIRIVEAIGSYGMDYIEDPHAPISKILNEEAALDTVRLPRDTLLIGSGDCDDTTALCASLLEAVGISTAIMTSPGHVFLAFDTGEPAEFSWLFNRLDFRSIVHDGSLWIPVETTVLNEGFMSSWKAGSLLIERYKSEHELEFLPVRSFSDTYPPIPLSESNFPIAEPAYEEVELRYTDSLNKLKEHLYHDMLDALQKELMVTETDRNLRIRNRIGILHAMFRNDKLSATIFHELIDDYPNNIPPYVNLANLRSSQGDHEEAHRMLLRAHSLSPGSLRINLLLVLSYQRNREYDKALYHYEIVVDRSPEIARGYRYLLDSGSEARSGVTSQILLWSSE